MKKNEEITDYASFLKAKYALKTEAEQERDLIGEELKKGVRQLNPTHLFAGMAGKAAETAIDSAINKTMTRVMESEIAKKVTGILSMTTFVKNMFRKKKDKDGENDESAEEKKEAEK